MASFRLPAGLITLLLMASHASRFYAEVEYYFANPQALWLPVEAGD